MIGIGHNLFPDIHLGLGIGDNAFGAGHQHRQPGKIIQIDFFFGGHKFGNIGLRDDQKRRQQQRLTQQLFSWFFSFFSGLLYMLRKMINNQPVA